MTRATWSQAASRVDLLSALHDTARQEPELCGLVRQRYVGSLHQAVEGVLAHAVERGDLPPRQADPSVHETRTRRLVLAADGARDVVPGRRGEGAACRLRVSSGRLFP
ncbi:hypothetical protein ACFY6U_05480 [Streptomyces sp. NPDC013157]|uniref:hypothetical protein n=1 Tax=Streptomyces sp. NPDC013157 TaxID=3364861 RepID=UPI0036A6129B